MTNIKVSNKLLIISVFALLLNSCTEISSADKSESQGAIKVLEHTDIVMPLRDFVSWSAEIENDLIKEKSFNDITYNLAYAPTEVLASIELSGQDFNKSQFNTACNNYNGMSYFKFRIEIPKASGELLKHKVSSSREYNDRLSYLSFEMKDDIFLVQGNDTIKTGLYHFERIFEVAPYSSVMIAFDNKLFNKEKEFTIVYDDHLFNKGFIKYTYYDNQLIDLPQIAGI